MALSSTSLGALEGIGGRVAVVLAVLGATLAGCAGGADDGGGSVERSRTIEPASPQVLAFATEDRVGIVDGARIRYLGKIARTWSGHDIDEIVWSGDGRQLAWLSLLERGAGVFDSLLTMVDVESGARHTWRDVNGPLTSGMSGVVAGGYEGRFTQFLPDGTREDYEIDLPPPPDPDRTEETRTEVRGALPLAGRWLLVAEDSDRLYMHANARRVFLFDPQRPRLIPHMSVSSGSWRQPTRIDDRHAVWVDSTDIGYCRHADELGGYRVRFPELPDHPDGLSWRIRSVTARGDEIDVLARGTGVPSADGEFRDTECARGDADYGRWTLRDGAWVEGQSGLLELDVAVDGRVAEVRGEVCDPFAWGDGCFGLGEGEYEAFRYGRGNVELEDGSSLALPTETRFVRFSPSSPFTVAEAVGDGPPLADTMRIDADGLGPLRLGATRDALQAATRTPLRFDLDEAGCGRVTLADAAAGQALGVEGRMVDGRLVSVVASTRDVAADEENPPISELQPDVSSVEARGPRTDRGVRAGDDLDRLLARHGEARTVDADPATQETVYDFAVGDSTLSATVDAVATVRRLEIHRGGRRPACAR
jgi:hypothetical protein